MKFVLLPCALYLLSTVVSGFWDFGTTTADRVITDTIPRQSFFRWQEVQPGWRSWFTWGWDWAWLAYNRRLGVVAGISHEFVNIGTATLLNRRVLITACNLLDDYVNVQMELRIWALGSRGEYNTPYRYRVWRFTRLYPKSLNPEHWHGPRGAFVPRHDVCIIHSLDQIMMLRYMGKRGHYPFRSYAAPTDFLLTNDLWFTGSGYEYLLHIKENYKIFITKAYKGNVVDCSKYLPKWWGKFICMKNVYGFPGIQNGGGLHSVTEGKPAWDYIVALGCFEIRYNEDRIFVFTDLRYYYNQIFFIGAINPGEYYEYAYPQWGMTFGFFFNSIYSNAPNIPGWQIKKDMYALGKK